MPSVHEVASVDAFFREQRVDRSIVRRLRNAYYKQFQAWDDAALELNEEQRTLTCGLEKETLTLLERHDSRLDGASKLILQTRAGLLLESVILRIATGRTTVCVSSQIGCAAKCRFCATGKMGVARNLSAAEILDQVLTAGRILAGEERGLRNIVFMGMGEPLHNEEALYEAIAVLSSARFFNVAPQRITVSTVGVPDAMIRCAQTHPKLRLALSLHSARPEIRQLLIPLARRHGLAALRDALLEVTAIQRQRVMVEYLMLADLTDTEEDICAIAGFLRGIPTTVNLIPYNRIEDAPDLRPSTAGRISEFAASLERAGIATTVRYSLGSDVAAACGQLIRRENRRLLDSDATGSLAAAAV